MVYVRQFVCALLLKAFPNLTPPQVDQFVLGLFTTQADVNTFKTHLRDFLVQLKVKTQSTHYDTTTEGGRGQETMLASVANCDGGCVCCVPCGCVGVQRDEYRRFVSGGACQVGRCAQGGGDKDVRGCPRPAVSGARARSGGGGCGRREPVTAAHYLFFALFSIAHRIHFYSHHFALPPLYSVSARWTRSRSHSRGTSLRMVKNHLTRPRWTQQRKGIVSSFTKHTESTQYA